MNVSNRCSYFQSLSLPFPFLFFFFFFNFYNIWNNFNLRSFNNFTGLSRYNWNRNWKTNLYCNSVAATAVAREIVSDNHNSVHEVKHHKFILKYTMLCSPFSFALIRNFFLFFFFTKVATVFRSESCKKPRVNDVYRYMYIYIVVNR